MHRKENKKKSSGRSDNVKLQQFLMVSTHISHERVFWSDDAISLHTCDAQSPSHHKAWNSSYKFQESEIFFFSHRKSLVYFLFPLHKLRKRINSQMASLNSMLNYWWLQGEGVSIENVLSSFSFPMEVQSSGWVQIMHAQIIEY